MDRTRLTLAALGALVSLLGCQPSSSLDKGEEEDAPLDGALDSFRAPRDHGPLTLGVPVRATIERDASFHAWTFELDGTAAVTLRTGEAGDGEVDTMLYLYREGPRGWGSYIARNDDVGGTWWSALSRTLSAGRYRVLVKGFNRRVRGAFELASECSGEGCPRVEEGGVCLFGETFGELLAGGMVSNVEAVTSLEGLDALAREQLVIAVRQSSHTDVTSAEEALARVDAGSMRRVRLWDGGAQRRFVGLEYGVGDSSYGAIFAHGTTTIVTRIQDGDLVSCTVDAAECAFGRTYRELRDSALFEPLLETRLTAATPVTGARAAQLVAAVQVAYEDATDVASALASVDEGEVNVLELRERATGRRFVAYEYGAGDNSYGAVFEGDTLERAVVINDGDLYDCAVLGAPGGARAGADCEGWTGAVCGEGLVCQGITEEHGAGRCAPEGRVEGEGEPCGAARACPSDALVCAGLTRGDEGICVPAWMRGSYGEGYALPIPAGGELVREVAVYGLATVDTDVEIRALLRHPRPRDLRVTLTNPAGTEVVVLDGSDAAPGGFELDGSVRGFSGDEQVNGVWTLRVRDRGRGEGGSLERWAIDVTSRWD